MGGWEKRYKQGDGHIGGLSIEGGFKLSVHYGLDIDYLLLIFPITQF